MQVRWTRVTSPPSREGAASGSAQDRLTGLAPWPPATVLSGEEHRPEKLSLGGFHLVPNH